MFRMLVLMLFLCACGCGRETMQELANEQGKFKIKMPAGYELKSNKFQDAEGRESIQFNFSFINRDHGYFVSYIDTHLPEKESDEKKFDRLKGSQNSSIQTKNATLVESKTSLLQDKYPSLQYISTTRDGKAVRSKEIFVKNRLYTIQAIGDAAFIKSDNVNELFDSFQVFP